MPSLDPRYTHLVQKPECCAITCLQMILYRRWFWLFDQQKLAKFFNVKINKKHKDAFNIKLKIMTNYNNDEGISTLDSANIVQEFFQKNNINLNVQTKKYSEIQNLENFIQKNIQTNNDLRCEYKTHQIHKQNRIHDSLIESIDLTTNTIILLDPDPKHPPRKEIRIDLLKKSIDPTHGKETGFLIISKQ